MVAGTIAVGGMVDTPFGMVPVTLALPELDTLRGLIDKLEEFYGANATKVSQAFTHAFSMDL